MAVTWALRRIQQVTNGFIVVIAVLAGLSVMPWLPQSAYAQEKQSKLLVFRQVEDVDLFSESALRSERKRLEAIRFIKGTDFAADARRTVELRMRLGDLYFQHGRILYLREMAALDDDLEQCARTLGCEENGLKPKSAESREWLANAVTIYRAILQEHPRSTWSDSITFYWATALHYVGQREESNRLFSKLLREYPQSQFAASSYMRLGEYFFGENDALRALVAFKKAAGYEESPVAPYARYRLAWCYYTVGDTALAAEAMNKVVEDSRGKQGPAGVIRLREEAWKSLAVFSAQAR